MNASLRLTLVLTAWVGLMAVIPAPASAGQAMPSESIEAAVAQYRSGAADEAEAAFLALLDSSPEVGMIHAYLGLIALDRGEVDAAKSRLEKAVELDPSSDHHLWLGRVLIAELQSANLFAKSVIAPKARRTLETAVELDPANAQARITLGNYYLNAPAIAGGSKAKARAQAEAIVPLDPFRWGMPSSPRSC